MDADLGRRFEQIGIVSYLCSLTPSLENLRFDYIVSAIVPAILHRQIYFAFDTFGIPIAFWTWAFLTKEVEDRLKSGDDRQLDESEWNEGDSLWIIDFVAPYGYVDSIMAFMKWTQFKGVSNAHGRRKRRVGDAYRTLSWKRRGDRNYESFRRFSSTYKLHASAFAASYVDWLRNPHRASIAF